MCARVCEGGELAHVSPYFDHHADWSPQLVVEVSLPMLPRRCLPLCLGVVQLLRLLQEEQPSPG